jgi:hypothetical protein
MTPGRLRARTERTETMGTKERDLTPLEHEVLRVVVVGNASLDLFRRHPRVKVEAAIKVLKNLSLIRMGARGYYIATAKGRRRRWAAMSEQSA